MNQNVTTLTPGGPALGVSLGFEARACLIDNYTNSFVRLPDVGVDLPPFVYGAVVALPPGLRHATASLVPTAPAVAGPPVPVAQATLTWTDEPLPASAGHLLQQSQFSSPKLLATIPSLNGTAQQDVTVPFGTESLELLVDDTGKVSQVQVIGKTTNVTYANYFTATRANPGRSPLDMSVETVYTVKAIGSNTGAALYVSAVTSVVLVDIKEIIDQVSVRLVDFFTGGFINSQVANGQTSLLVSNVKATPAPWQAATLNAPVTIASVAAGGTQTLIAATPGVTLYLHGHSFSQDNANAAANWQLQDTSGNIIASWFDTNVRKVFASGDFRGFPVAIGRGIQMLNGGANASFLGGFLSYSTG